ncbi:M48 family metalloprotease [Telmatospirillum sp. J64-1]|uniref:M48 family metalloprotease n=1 Tax=Telmatospirillum sp. J64-1 TaxID=2502183 RepID=UPI002102C48E|nr:M48 family metalloprotease [Telmatospirillum sp. J64-1]
MSLSSRLRALLLPSFAALSLAACQVAPGTGQQSFNLLSPAQEQQMGAQEHPRLLEAFGGVYDENGIQEYVTEIGWRLLQVSETPDAQYTFTVLNSDIVNAMALPGGYVYVTRGLLALADNEAELAGVLAHEIGHVTGRHSASRYSRGMAANLGAAVLGILVGSQELGQVAQTGAAAYLQNYSRDQEFEADALGIRYMSLAGYDASAMASFLDKLRQQASLEARIAGRDPSSVDEFNWMASHPRTLDRVQRAMEASLSAPPQGSLARDTYLDRIDGLLYGDDPSKGVVRGRQFLHPDLRLAFDMPQGFTVLNQDDAVIGRHPSGAMAVFDGGRLPQAGDMTTYLTQSWGRNSRLSQVEAIEINSLPAATAVTQVDTQRGRMDARLVAIRFDADTVYRFMFITPPNLTQQMSLDLRKTTYSFRKLSAAEAAAIQPYRLRVVRVRPGDSVESLAARLPYDDGFNLDRFLMLNNLQPGQPLREGQRVKIISDGRT